MKRRRESCENIPESEVTRQRWITDETLKVWVKEIMSDSTPKLGEFTVERQDKKRQGPSSKYKFNCGKATFLKGNENFMLSKLF